MRVYIFLILGMTAARASADGEVAPQSPKSVVAAMEHAADVYRKELRFINQQTDRMRSLMDEIPQPNSGNTAYQNSAATSKSVLDRSQSMAKILETRATIEQSMQKIEKLTENMGRIADQYPGIENKIEGGRSSTVKTMIQNRNLSNAEAILRASEFSGATRMSIYEDEAEPLRKPLELKFANGKRINLKPGAHVRIRLTGGNDVLEGPVMQRQAGWHEELIMRTKDPGIPNTVSYYGTALKYIKSIEILNADGSSELIETGQVTNTELRMNSRNARQLGEFLSRSKSTSTRSTVIEAMPIRSSTSDSFTFR